MDQLEAMKILLQVVRTGSFSAASKHSGIPLATVSRKVKELEKHLGTRLLTRTTRKVELTDTGTTYAASAQRILDQVEDAERIAAGELHTPRGELVLTAPLLFGRLHILPIVTHFLAAYPQINIRLRLSDRNLHLIDDQIDMAVRIGPLPDSSLVATRVGSMRTVVCASPKLLKSTSEPTSPDQLTTFPCVSFDPLSLTSTWTFQLPASPLPAHGQPRTGSTTISIEPRLSVSTAEAAVWAATQGVGATRVLHYQCAEALHQRKLRAILTAFEPPPLPIHLLHASRGTLPSKMRLFLDFASVRLRDQLSALETGKEQRHERSAETRPKPLPTQHRSRRSQ